MPYMLTPDPTPTTEPAVNPLSYAQEVNTTGPPAWYTPPTSASPVSLLSSTTSTMTTMNTSFSAKPPLKTIFGSLAGTWTLHRRLTSSLPHYPSGNFTGSATFTPHTSFSGASYLYHETGELRTDTGMILRANQKYIYRFDEDNEKIAIWFVKSEGQGVSSLPPGDEEPDYLYMELELEQNEIAECWVGKGDHLCVMDMYWGYYEFKVKDEGDSMQRFGIQYKVKGPSKDYLSETAYVKR